jgi:hypothetical protein
MPRPLPTCPNKSFGTFWTVDAFNCSDHPFDDLKAVLLGRFGKSMWQSYFELLRLPPGMDGIKPSILVSKRNYSFLTELL